MIYLLLSILSSTGIFLIFRLIEKRDVKTFPVVFSILYDAGDKLSLLKVTGILVALPGVLFTIYKKRDRLPDPSLLYLPLILFLGMGVVDSLVKLAQYEYVSDANLSLFTALLFGISALIGILISLTGMNRLKSLFNFRVLAWGILLGVVNFGSIFFLVRTLNYRHPLRGSIDSSVIFGINNIGIVALSVLLGILLFRERLSRINITGIIICIMATILLACAS